MMKGNRLLTNLSAFLDIKNPCKHNIAAARIVLYVSGRQTPGRGPVPIRARFIIGPYLFSE